RILPGIIHRPVCFIQRCCQLPFLSLQLCNLLRCFYERLCFLPTLLSQFVDRFGLCIYATSTVSVAFCFVGHNVASSNLYLRLWTFGVHIYSFPFSLSIWFFKSSNDSSSNISKTLPQLSHLYADA